MRQEIDSIDLGIGRTTWRFAAFTSNLAEPTSSFDGRTSGLAGETSASYGARSASAGAARILPETTLWRDANVPGSAGSPLRLFTTKDTKGTKDTKKKRWSNAHQ
jgi:hypothetical protein